MDATLAHEEARILGGGGRGDTDPGVSCRDDEAQRGGVGGELARGFRVGDYRDPVDFAQSFCGRGLSRESARAAPVVN